MSNSSASSSPQRQQEAEFDDPLCITENDRRHFKESEAIKRKCVTPDDSDDGSTKKQKTDENGTAKTTESESDDDEIDKKSSESDEEEKPQTEASETRAGSGGDSKDEFDVKEKLKHMNEISVQPIIKIEKDQIEKESEDAGDKVSVEISKKDKKELQDRKVQNLRKNIKDVLDDTQLDATTLAAQRLESERLARVQEQQRLIREAQRQMAAEKQSNKTQQKVLSLLQGGESSDPSSTAIDLDDPILEKFSLSSAVSITPAAKAALQSIQSLMSTDDQIPDSDIEDEASDDDDVVIQPDESMDKSKAVVVDSSSDSDDCIILSDDEDEGVEEDDENNSGEHTNDSYNQRDSEGRVVVNIGHGENESKIYVAPQIARIIKPHQIGGVRFLFDNIIESINLFDKSSGFGCILAHSMGLGKTLQLVCFCDIFLRHTSSKSVLVIMPINTLQNWLHEFNMWLPLPEDVDKSPLKKDGEVRPRQFKIFVLNDSHKTLNARAKTVLDWSKEGGVLMMGYEIYRLLSLKKMKQKRRKGAIENEVTTSQDQDLFDKIHAALVCPGPDLVVCDEGHRIKNAHASTSLALKQIKSKRRVVLTGYPLQNNLLEYWCMVDFVRPSYLGTKTEFSNMFERPILNGQCIDSTPQDCKLMRYRAHVLHSLLKGFVQRRSHTVLQKCLPEKTEFVMLVRMTPFQRKLYNIFMDEVVRSRKVPNPLKAFSVCCKIWNHPDVLYNFLKKRELDLDIELEEAEALRKPEVTPGPKKRGRKAKETPTKKDDKKVSELEKPVETKVESVKAEPPESNGVASGDSFKPPMTPSSNDSAYSSNQSVNSSFDSTSNYNNSYSGYQNYDTNSYQNYNYNGGNSGNGFQQQQPTPQQQQQPGWNNYYQNQNNYYQSDYAQNNYYQQQNSFQQPYYANSNFQSFDQKPPPPLMPKLEPIELKPEPKKADLLLADVIKEEAKEQREKDSRDSKDDLDLKDLILTKHNKDDGIPYDWAVDLMKDYVSDLMENSPKMEIFFCILEESIRMGDRLLVFSQSLLTLNILERFLQRAKIPNSEPEAHWAKNTSYFRLDGSTAALEREKLINEFNSNTKVKLFLVSTRAGSLGINLVGANRVVVFDASWNPCHDTQAVCRVYRYGQAKSCYVYRFVMDNCLEKKIYDRQINKQGMADRVVDECNPDANLSMKEVTSLCYDDGEDPEISDFKEEMAEYKDLVTKKILELHATTLTKKPFQHESLLVDRKEKKLSQAEKRLAQRGYEMEKQAASKPTFNYNSVGSNYRAFRTTDGSLIHRPVGSVRPVQSDLGDPMNTVRSINNPPKPNRWVPVEVWQSKGLTAQEMTLPQDVSIQTNSADKSKIYLKAGQKVIVLKSPKGICLQLESGKVIAIRASVKGGQQVPGVEQKLGNFSGLSEPVERPKFQAPRNDGDVIDISNDDDEEESSAVKSILPDIPATQQAPPMNTSNGSSMNAIPPVESIATSSDTIYKEKVVYKPNLVQRTKPKMPPPSIPMPDSQPLKRFDSSYQSQQRPPPPKWDVHKDFSATAPHSNMFNRDMNGSSKNHSVPFRNSTESSRKPEETLTRSQPSDTSAFHPPAGASTSTLPSSITPAGPYIASTYPEIYQGNSSFPNPTYPPTPSSNNYNYPYHHASYPNAPPSYHYPQAQAAPGSFDPNFQTYHQSYNSMNYNQIAPPPHSYPPPINPDPTTQVPFTPPPSSNYGQWNYNT